MRIDAVILTALPIESRAVCSHLRDLREHTSPEGTIYMIGAIEGLTAAVAEVGVGNDRAAGETTRALTLFSPRLVAFVGVAGGRKDAEIGDVVVATRVYGYDSGKEGERFQARPDVGETSYRVEQRARLCARTDTWHGQHQCSRIPRIHIGPIAAGPKVVTSTKSPSAKRIGSHYEDALAVEMESRGVLAAARSYPHVLTLIVRGISDRLDNKSQSDAGGSQQIAAEHAALLAFVVIRQLFSQVDALGQQQWPVEIKTDASPTETKTVVSELATNASSDLEVPDVGTTHWAPQSVDSFDRYLSRGFPGVRGTVTYSNPLECVRRLQRFLGPPVILMDHLEHASLHPAWVFRGSSTFAIESCRTLDERTVLINRRELHPTKLVVHHAPSPWHNIVYVEAAAARPAQPSYESYYSPTFKGRVETEEYALFRGRVISRAEYDDGWCEIDDESVEIDDAELRDRVLTPSNWLIVPQGTPINEGALDAKCKEWLDDILLGKATIEAFLEQFFLEKQRKWFP